MKSTKLQRIPEYMAPQKGEIRLFKNSLLERLSKISPLTVLIVYLPLIVLSIWKSFSVGITASVFIGLLVAGIAFWTLFEYVFHRFVFHFEPRGEFQKQISFLFHGVHHQYPNDKQRLVMPIALSLLIAVVLFGLFYSFFGETVWPFFTGFVLGYLSYDMIHYSIHHFERPSQKWLGNLWKSHLDHHFRDSSKGFGVSSPIWDKLIGTHRKA